MNKIKEWRGWNRILSLCANTFVAGCLLIFVAALIVVIFDENLFKSIPDQPKMSIAERKWDTSKLPYKDFAIKVPFNPATMEIIVDTVGWEVPLYGKLVGYKLTVSWGDTNLMINDTVGISFDAETDRPILDSTTVPKTSPLLSREENEILIELLGEYAKERK